MMIDDDESKRPKSAILVELQKEDLDRLSREELSERIDALQAEIKRTDRALSAKGSLQDVAASLFKK